jgi:hypothetical protein
MDKLNIPQGSRVYLDSSILIYTVEVDLQYQQLNSQILAIINRDKLRVCV